MPSKANADAPHPLCRSAQRRAGAGRSAVMLIKSFSFGRMGHLCHSPLPIAPQEDGSSLPSLQALVSSFGGTKREPSHQDGARRPSGDGETGDRKAYKFPRQGVARITLRAGLAGIRIHDMHPMFATWSLQNGIDPTTQILRDHRTDDQEERAVDEATPIVVIGRPPCARARSSAGRATDF